jgi:hypothetical protein
MKQPPLEKLKDTFKKFPDILAVYLFGSATTNRIHNEFDSGTYYSRVIRQYLDFMPYWNTQRKAYKDRILNGAR